MSIVTDAHAPSVRFADTSPAKLGRKYFSHGAAWKTLISRYIGAMPPSVEVPQNPSIGPAADRRHQRHDGEGGGGHQRQGVHRPQHDLVAAAFGAGS